MPLSNIINTPTIFTGGDTKFWNRFGKSFVKSFKHFNPDKTVHVHIFDPTDNDLKELESLTCNYSFEYTDQTEIVELVENAKMSLESVIPDEAHKWQLKSCMKYFDDIPDMQGKLLKLMKFTKFASTRFIRLSEMWDGNCPVLAYDMDTICMGNINFSGVFKNQNQSCLVVKGGRFVVSLVGFQNNSLMLKEWATHLSKAFETKKVYGFLDQDTFVNLSTIYPVNKVERLYCDHTNKNAHSIVITGKGAMKESEMFLNLVDKWNQYGNA